MIAPFFLLKVHTAELTGIVQTMLRYYKIHREHINTTQQHQAQTKWADFSIEFQ